MIIAAFLMFSFGVVAAIIRPRLRLVSTGASPTVTVRTIFGAQTYAATDVQRIRILEFRRMGRQIGHLEFEFDPQETQASESDVDDSRIVVMGRWELGVDVHDVADALDAAGFHVER
ncbi:PH domain-containing protein [Gordonia sp. TBRC 11910]|uniref:PH domain-containing protein n=1 Tax=Gordonia asplenii TaxID=2725283 RepID=A0A848KVN3_9ACTN|nr:PH domain-containing protein [Gordonia asplenii]NMO02620.1 PH domain-containing protein [Gordonia asplenii]